MPKEMSVINLAGDRAAPDTYRVDARCSNCRWEGWIRQRKGYRMPGTGLGSPQKPKCPNCECRTVVPHA